LRFIGKNKKVVEKMGEKVDERKEEIEEGVNVVNGNNGNVNK
jgi:acetyl/propionyl-CoA carboxylase alpha subunit